MASLFMFVHVYGLTVFLYENNLIVRASGMTYIFYFNNSYFFTKSYI